ncbi:hypothetical protein E2C01_008484 [Portunus trituberculatus]|uniref:Uncharacterized protein n=1 Tax=Portunus trituberculatus TaxID=210409 RepID=A0A5B7D4N8_PORTR|nr:hypothetical protein [Portunus trituberculatus]
MQLLHYNLSSDDFLLALSFTVRHKMSSQEDEQSMWWLAHSAHNRRPRFDSHAGVARQMGDPSSPNV